MSDQCRDCQAIAQLFQVKESLEKGLAEALGYLRYDDSPGRACECCRGVTQHYAGCKIALAEQAIRNTLNILVEA